MIKVDTTLRVRYGETDKMGFVYYGNYPLYYEVGRTNLIREFGITYRNLEDSGVLMPVYDLSVRYIKSATYDELLTVRTFLKELPTVRIKFDYEIYNEKQELINTGETTLLFLDANTMRPIRAPKILMDAIESSFIKV